MLNPMMIGITGTTLGIPLILLLFFISARYIEYIRLRKLLRDGTTQAIRELLMKHKRIGYRVLSSSTIRDFVFAMYELGATRSQQYVFRKAVLAETPSLARYIIQLMELCPHKRSTLKTWFFPAI